MTADDLLNMLREKGVQSDSLRDAVHEASHAVECGCPDDRWGDREAIHAAVCRRHPRPAHQVREEVEARATEWEACERYGIDYDVESWALMAAMEAIRGGVSMPHGSWLAGIRLAKEDGTGAVRLDRLLAHLGVVENPDAE
jgi:hypothetical protein